jgi:hypothetical protein
MLVCEALCLSTQSVFFLRLKLKRELNVLLPARVGLGAPAFEYPMRDFFEAQKVDGVCIVGCGGFCWSFVARL